MTKKDLIILSNKLIRDVLDNKPTNEMANGNGLLSIIFKEADNWHRSQDWYLIMIGGEKCIYLSKSLSTVQFYACSTVKGRAFVKAFASVFSINAVKVANEKLVRFKSKSFGNYTICYFDYVSFGFNSSLSYDTQFRNTYKANNKVSEMLISLTNRTRRFSKIRAIRLSEKEGYLIYKPPFSEQESEIKIGKLIKKLAGETGALLTDYDIEKYVNIVKSLSEDNFEFEIVQEEEIKKYYKGRRYINDDNSLGGSCMKECSSSYFDIYANNPDVCSMLIHIDHNTDLIQGRALLWKADCGTLIMDRIYGSDAVIQKFKNWAKENGYIYKERQSYDYKDTWIDLEGETVEKHFTITLDVKHDYYPYIDTFTYVCDGYLTNNCSDSESVGMANSTDGDGWYDF